MSAEAWSDGLGFASGIVLLVTAFRNDGLTAFVNGLRAKIAEARKTDPDPDKFAGQVVEALEQDLKTWTPVDRWALRVGAGLLCLSYGFKAVPALLKALGTG